jgi:hypothetical protein
MGAEKIDFKRIMDDVDVAEQTAFSNLMNERIFYLKDTNVSSRLYNLWKNADLLDSQPDIDSRKWVKLNFLEYVWLNIVRDMRVFGLSFEVIKNLKKELLSDIEKIVPRAAIEESKLEEITIGLFQEKEKCSYEKAKQMLDEIIKESKVDSLYQLIRKQMGKNFTVLGYNLFLSALKKSDSILIIYLVNDPKKTGEDDSSQLAYSIFNELVFLKADDLSLAKEILFSKPHLQLPLFYYITTFIKKHLKKSTEIGWLSPDEVKLLELVREGKAKTITIKFKNKKPEMLEVTKFKEGNLESELIKKFSKYKHAEVTCKIQGGKVQHFTITDKFKLNDK